MATRGRGRRRRRRRSCWSWDETERTQGGEGDWRHCLGSQRGGLRGRKRRVAVQESSAWTEGWMGREATAIVFPSAGPSPPPPLRFPSIRCGTAGTPSGRRMRDRRPSQCRLDSDGLKGPGGRGLTKERKEGPSKRRKEEQRTRGEKKRRRHSSTANERQWEEAP